MYSSSNAQDSLGKTSVHTQVRDAGGLQFWRTIKPYIQLTKPTIVMLVVVTTVPSMLLPFDTLPSLPLFFATIMGTFFAAASASVFNQVFEEKTDQLMTRTARRPVASGKISKEIAIGEGVILGVMSIVILLTYVNITAAAIAFVSILFYAGFYTLYLKPRTPQNIVIGGAAGAVGPLIGWAAVTGTLEWPAWALFAIIFFWTPPHFWALALKYKDDYAQAKVPMYPVIYGEEKTKKAILLYTLLLFPMVLPLGFYAGLGWFYLVGASIFTVLFAKLSYDLYRDKGIKYSMPLFLYSCLYLFFIFGLLTVERLFKIAFL